jgi:uncharacterized protein
MAQPPSGLQGRRDEAAPDWTFPAHILDSACPDRYDALMRVTDLLTGILTVVILGFIFVEGRSPALAVDSRLIPIRTPSGITIQAEIADTPLKRATGLMYRDRLDKDHGMLFFFGQPQAWTFWMKNTKIALDLIWLDGKQRVVHIERQVPICTKTDDSCPQYRPNSDQAMYVLEIAGGTVEGYKIEKGSTLQFKKP